VEILDSAGSSYVDILNYLNKTIADANKRKTEFGLILDG
jgi:hypothetical protein